MLDEKVNDEDIFYFKDLMTTFEQDRVRNLSLANAGYIPKWKYLMKYEGYSEEEAKAAVLEASGKESKGLFGEE